MQKIREPKIIKVKVAKKIRSSNVEECSFYEMTMSIAISFFFAGTNLNPMLQFSQLLSTLFFTLMMKVPDIWQIGEDQKEISVAGMCKKCEDHRDEKVKKVSGKREKQWDEIGRVFPEEHG